MKPCQIYIVVHEYNGTTGKLHKVLNSKNDDNMLKRIFYKKKKLLPILKTNQNIKYFYKYCKRL